MSIDEHWPGDPAGIWAATRPTAGRTRRTPPDLRDFEEFERLAAPGDSAIGGAVIYTVGGLFFLVTGIVGLIFRPDAPDASMGTFFSLFAWAVRWYPLLALAAGIGFLVAAPLTFRRERRNHPQEIRDLYEAACDRGILVETTAARFRIFDTGDGWVEAAVGVDVRLDPVAATRIRTAFHRWFTLLEQDRKAAQAMRVKNGRGDVRRAEDVFGPEAAGGFLLRLAYDDAPFALLIPDPPNNSARWEELPVAAPLRNVSTNG